MAGWREPMKEVWLSPDGRFVIFAVKGDENIGEGMDRGTETAGQREGISSTAGNGQSSSG